MHSLPFLILSFLLPFLISFAVSFCDSSIYIPLLLPRPLHPDPMYDIPATGEEASLDISVNIPGGLVRSGKLNFMDVLNSIPPETIRLKQIAIAKYAPHIQYAMPPLELLKNRSDITPWDPPFKDGVDFTLDGLFVRTSHAVNNQSTGIPHRLMTSREWSKEYDVVKVKTPGMTLVPFVLTRVIPSVDVQGQKGHKKGHKKHLKNDGAQIQGKKETKMGSNS